LDKKSHGLLYIEEKHETLLKGLHNSISMVVYNNINNFFFIKNSCIW